MSVVYVRYGTVNQGRRAGDAGIVADQKRVCERYYCEVKRGAKAALQYHIISSKAAGKKRYVQYKAYGKTY